MQMSIISHFAGSAMQNTPKSDDLGNDLVIGMRAIAEFWGMPERKAYYMASKGLFAWCFPAWQAMDRQQIRLPRRCSQQSGGPVTR
jgi:hypothetical protein